MKKNYFITIILSILVCIFIKDNIIVKDAVSESIDIWVKSIIPSMLPMYLIVDLLINYSSNYVKSNYLFLIIINMLLGSPSNAKYIKEFYLSNKIDLNTSNLLLIISYSPNPLFLINICPNKQDAFKVLLFIYITNLIMFLLLNKKYKLKNLNKDSNIVLPFNECLTNSIYKTYNILILILGIITFYMIIINLINHYFKNMFLINILLEMTNGIILSLDKINYLKYILLITSFGGLSIHSQIKSILENTPINYKYFLFGRLFALSISLILFMF